MILAVINLRKRLHFNSSSAGQDLFQAINKAADNLIREYYTEVYSKLSTLKGKAALEILSENEESIIKRKIIGYADAIIDSFGTGSKMDRDNPALNAYMNSEYWNRLRQGYTIVGREQGTYTDIYGKTEYSAGTMAGTDLESTGIVKAKAPSYAFQRADTWFFGGNRTAEVLNAVIRKFFTSYNMAKYFTFG